MHSEWSRLQRRRRWPSPSRCRTIHALVGDGTLDVDGIVRRTGLAAGAVAAALAELELLGLVTHSEGLVSGGDAPAGSAVAKTRAR